jgi:hypothetical protein
MPDMKRWEGVLGLLDTPTADGRFLWGAGRPKHRNLPKPLLVTGPMFNAQVGVLTQLSIVDHTLIGAGDLDLRLLTLLNTSMAETLAAGQPVAVGLNIETPSMRANQRGCGDALTDDELDPFKWSITGAHLTEHPAWTEARIVLTELAPDPDQVEPSPPAAQAPDVLDGADRRRL